MGPRLGYVSFVFEILDHPADIGFRAFGQTLAELFANAALAMVSIAYEIEAVSPIIEYPLEATGFDAESLLVNWLNEVLFWTDGRQIALHHFRVKEIDSVCVNAIGTGEPWDARRHRGKLVVKAATYHQLKIGHSPDRWYAEVYLDI